MHFVLETLFVRLISSASINAPPLIQLVGCSDESFSNEQGQLDTNLITRYFNLVQGKTTGFGNFFCIFVVSSG